LFVIYGAISAYSLPPDLQIVYPMSDNFECSTLSIPVMGHVDCENCSLKINNNEAKILEDGSFTSEVPLELGTNSVTLTVQDEAGNIFQRILTITRLSDEDNKILPESETIPFPPPIVQPGKAPEDMTKKRFSPVPKLNSTKLTQTTTVRTQSNSAKSAKSTTFFIDGQRIKPDAAPAVKVIKNRMYFSPSTRFYAVAGIDSGSKNPGNIVFYPGTPIRKNVFVKCISPDHRPLLPLRAAFQQAGWRVHWEKGAVFLYSPVKPSEVAITLNNNTETQIKLPGFIKNGKMFVFIDGLSSIPGVSAAVDPTGKFLSFSRATSDQEMMIINVNLRNFFEKPSPESGEKTPRTSSVAVRDLSRIGFSVIWSDSEKIALLIPDFSISSTK